MYRALTLGHVCLIPSAPLSFFDWLHMRFRRVRVSSSGNHFTNHSPMSATQPAKVEIFLQTFSISECNSQCHGT